MYSTQFHKSKSAIIFTSCSWGRGHTEGFSISTEVAAVDDGFLGPQAPESKSAAGGPIARRPEDADSDTICERS